MVFFDKWDLLRLITATNTLDLLTFSYFAALPPIPLVATPPKPPPTYLSLFISAASAPLLASKLPAVYLSSSLLAPLAPPPAPKPPAVPEPLPAYLSLSASAASIPAPAPALSPPP